MNQNDFRKYAVHHLGMNGLALDQFMSATASNITSSYINPTIIEERQLNVAQMDVFSRLMMDRIIFLGTDVNDYTANVIQAQLLYLDQADSGKDVSIYIMPDWESTTQCNIFQVMLLQFVLVWQLLWQPYFLLLVQKASVSLLNTLVS